MTTWHPDGFAEEWPQSEIATVTRRRYNRGDICEALEAALAGVHRTGESAYIVALAGGYQISLEPALCGRLCIWVHRLDSGAYRAEEGKIER